MKSAHDKNSPGYLIPANPQPEDNICICLPIPKDEGHILAFLGQLLKLSYWYTWEREATKSGKLAADAWLPIYECAREAINNAMTKNCGCGCNDPLELQQRLAENGSLEVSEDGGVTWRAAERTEDPRTAGSLTQPVDTSTAGGKCAAANAFVTAMKDAVQAIIDKKELGGLAADITSLVIGLMVGLGVIATGGALAVFGAGLAAVVAHYTTSEFEEAFTSSVWDDLLCLIFCAMDDTGHLSQADALSVAAQIQSSHPGIAGDTLHDLITSLGEVGTTNATRSKLPGTLSCEACPCIDACENPELKFYWGNVTETTVNEDGSVTMEVAAELIDGSYVIRWGTIGVNNCCKVTGWIDHHESGGTPEWAYWICGNLTGSPNNFVGFLDEACYGVVQNYNNFATGAPFTATITIEACPSP